MFSNVAYRATVHRTGLNVFFSFEFVGYYLSSYDEAKIGSKLLTGSWRQKIDSGPGMNEPTNLLLQIQVGFPCSEKLFYPLWGFESCTLWQYRLWSFQGRDTKLERFLSKKSTVVKWNYWILRIGVMASCQKLGIILEKKVI